MIILSKNILENKLKLASAAVLVLVPLYTWKTLYSTYKHLKKKHAEKVLFHQRHNCVIMYANRFGMSGWPPYKERIQLNITDGDSMQLFFEPIVYFIETAEHRLDVAFMLINVDEIRQAFVKAYERGVKVRIILNFDHYQDIPIEFKQMKESGMDITFYVSGKLNMGSIMHYKYIIKDSFPNSGYALTGSLNISNSAFISNYEDIVISSNQYITEAFQKDFDRCWNYITTENKNVLNRIALMDANWVSS